jgi:type II secretory pathway component PulF
MSTASIETLEPEPARWWFAGCAFALVAVATVLLFWLLYRYVPLHMSLAAGMGMELPLGARLASFAGNWLVRMLPFLVLAGLPLGAIALVLLAVTAQKMRIRTRAVVRWLTVVGLLVALAEILASAYVVHEVHEVYVIAATSPGYEQTLRDIEEFRKVQKLPPGADR